MRLFACLSFVFLTLFPLWAFEEKAETLYQKAPENWRAEVIPLPLPFAPDMDLKGVEELRFSPGMYQADSETYFTYTFIWWLEDKVSFTTEILEDHFFKYFAGLYKAVSKKETKDVSGFKVQVQQLAPPKSLASYQARYRGMVQWIDPFVTEQKLDLRFEMRVWFCPKEQRTAAFVALSPKPYDHPIWQAMAEQKAGQCETAP